MKHLILVTLPAAAIIVMATSAAAQITQSDPDPTLPTNAPERETHSDWQARVGGGLQVGQPYLGSERYQLSAVPFAEVRYKDRYFLSVFEGLGADLVKTESFRAGPILFFDSGRKESGKTFRIAGKRDTSLLGLGDIKGSAVAGGFAEYQSGRFSGKIEVLESLGGANGLVAHVGARYTAPIRSLALTKKPVTVSIGPRLEFVDGKRNDAYFGVTAVQSLRSELPQFTAKGGLQSYGAGATLLVPVSSSLSALVLGGYDRLTGDAANSPLVKQRGSPNQATVAMGLIYRIGR